jgi:hypothetical protein
MYRFEGFEGKFGVGLTHHRLTGFTPVFRPLSNRDGVCVCFAAVTAGALSTVDSRRQLHGQLMYLGSGLRVIPKNGLDSIGRTNFFVQLAEVVTHGVLTLAQAMSQIAVANTLAQGLE